MGLVGIVNAFLVNFLLSLVLQIVLIFSTAYINILGMIQYENATLPV